MVCVWLNAGVVAPADREWLCYFYMLVIDLEPLVSSVQSLFNYP
jgi:hypothetical protein